jgi:hypothetical protein
LVSRWKDIFRLPSGLHEGQEFGVSGVTDDSRKKTDVVQSMRRSCAKVTIGLEQSGNLILEAVYV